MASFENFIGVILLTFAVHVYTTLGQSVKVLVPPNLGADEAALIVVPGADIRGDTYEPLALEIQSQAPFSLWVALTTDYPSDTPNPISLRQAVEMALAQLTEGGMSSNAPIFMAGHSLGGTFLQAYVDENPNDIAGMMLWGSYLTGSTEDLNAFPTPVMHLSGDLDGQVRITRNAIPFRELVQLANGNSDLIATKPVVIVEGTNHFQFASGEIPPFVAQEDLPADVDLEVAHELLAEPIVAFIAYNLGVSRNFYRDMLVTYHEETAAKMAPLTTALTLEWDETSGESQWVTVAQANIAGFDLSSPYPVDINDVGSSTSRQFASSTPVLTADSITTASLVTFRSNAMDLSSIKESATEIAGKMKSREAVKAVVPEAGQTPAVSCKEINENALDYALSIAPDVVLQRMTRGYDMIFQADIESSSEDEWLSTELDLTSLADGSLQVTSTSYFSEVEGVSYCKLLSPHRALEWLYVDSLRPVHAK
ncbi:uncharacterized protein [Diadema setosum]|uniref:uncharacterized protein n=1 Tax=Diadema setosum TaxID=31175 RepID=UPI003B3B6E16